MIGQSNTYYWYMYAYFLFRDKNYEQHRVGLSPEHAVVCRKLALSHRIETRLADGGADEQNEVASFRQACTKCLPSQTQVDSSANTSNGAMDLPPYAASSAGSFGAKQAKIDDFFRRFCGLCCRSFLPLLLRLLPSLLSDADSLLLMVLLALLGGDTAAEAASTDEACTSIRYLVIFQHNKTGCCQTKR